MDLEGFIKKNKVAFDEHKMPDSARQEFEARLKDEIHRPAFKSKKLRRIKTVSIAASIVFVACLGLLFTGERLDQLKDRDELILALGENQASSTRLAAIYEIEDFNRNRKEDEKILEAFFKILKAGSDTNSKIAVIDALMLFPDNPLVRTNIIEALAIEDEPLVQLKLIKSVTLLMEKRAKVPLEKIIENKESLPLVKGNASATLAMLNQKKI